MVYVPFLIILLGAGYLVITYIFPLLGSVIDSKVFVFFFGVIGSAIVYITRDHGEGIKNQISLNKLSLPVIEKYTEYCLKCIYHAESDINNNIESFKAIKIELLSKLVFVLDSKTLMKALKFLRKCEKFDQLRKNERLLFPKKFVELIKDLRIVVGKSNENIDEKYFEDFLRNID